MDDFQAELLAAFAAELAEHLAGIRAALADADAGRSVDLREFGRRLHSLKGAARAVSMPEVEQAAHSAETLLAEVEGGRRPLDPPTLSELKAFADRIEDGAAPKPAGTPTEPERVGVAGRHVDRLARTLHVLSGQLAAQAEVSDALAAVQDALSGLAPLLAAHDTEGGRRLARAAQDLERARRDHARLRHDLDTTAAELERRSDRILLQPIRTLFEGHERMVRELAASQGKQVSLRIDEVPGDADRRVLQGLREPLLHLLRNAVGHGLETAAQRLASGKPAAGSVTVEPRAERGRLLVTIIDDGAGLDYRGIEARARAAGLIAHDAPAPGMIALRRLLFAQGLSTAQAIDAVSGRGIGLAAVAEAVRRLHGTVRIGDAPGGGTRVRLSVPLALSRQTLLLVEAAGTTYAIPADAVESVLRMSPGDLVADGASTAAMIDGEPVPVARLSDITGNGAAAPAAATQALVLDAGGSRRVLLVDELHDVRAMVVGDPVAVAADVPLVFGTVLLGDTVVLVLAPEALVGAPAGPAAIAPPAGAAEEARRATVLVVDDSITTRTLERSILEAQGYRVLVDVDGLAALERLRSGAHAVDLVVADVEMPRMDGFGLLAAIRNDPALGSLPVVMMTSRNHPDDIERGLSLGASAYVTKQDFDQGTLISVVQQLL